MLCIIVCILFSWPMISSRQCFAGQVVTTPVISFSHISIKDTCKDVRLSDWVVCLSNGLSGVTLNWFCSDWLWTSIQVTIDIGLDTIIRSVLQKLWHFISPQDAFVCLDRKKIFVFIHSYLFKCLLGRLFIVEGLCIIVVINAYHLYYFAVAMTTRILVWAAC